MESTSHVSRSLPHCVVARPATGCVRLLRPACVTTIVVVPGVPNPCGCQLARQAWVRDGASATASVVGGPLLAQAFGGALPALALPCTQGFSCMAPGMQPCWAVSLGVHGAACTLTQDKPCWVACTKLVAVGHTTASDPLCARLLLAPSLLAPSVHVEQHARRGVSEMC